MSTIPATIDALVTAVTAAAGDVQVMDGPMVGVAPHADHILIGGEPDDFAVTGEQAAGAFGTPRREEFEIVVRAAAYDGGGTQKQVRDRAFAHMAIVETVLTTNPKLGGVVLKTQGGGQIALDQRPATDINEVGEEVVVGRKAVVTFRVACLGWIT